MKPRFLVLAAAVLVATAVLVWSYPTIFPNGNQGGSSGLTGSLFVSDAGQSHGGFEYTASYNVSVQAKSGQGVMTAGLNVGLGDTLTKHEFAVTDLLVNEDRVSMRVDGQLVELLWTPVDSVWSHEFDRYYIASWGSSAPSEEIRGSVSPSVFPGVPASYYVELRLVTT